jgi:lipopolysaccharide export system protein LptC
VSRAVLLPSLLALLAACSPSRPPEGPAEEQPQVVLHGVRLRSYEGSTLSMTGTAEHATFQRSGDITATQGAVRVLGAGEGDGPPGGLTVRARHMEGNLGTRHMVASGDVEVRTASGMVAHTPRATYDGALRSAHGSEGVRVTGPDYRLNADAFSLSFPDEAFTFEGSVRTVVGATRD